MSIIDWFKKKPVEQTTATDDMLFGFEDSNHPGNVIPFVAPQPTNNEPLKLVQPSDNREKEPVYTVGLNDFNETILRLCNNKTGITMTLTMNPVATQQLIRLLEATLTETDIEDNDRL